MTEQPEPGKASFDWGWADDEMDWVPSDDVDISKPSPARVYDYVLGGKDNYPVDRAAAARLMEVVPDYPVAARANREFLARAVQTMAESGVRQFLDLGTGIPTSPNVHEVARTIHPDARIVYVDNDPIVMAHNRARRAVTPGILTVPHDLREPAAVLGDPVVRAHLDFDQPIGLLVIAVLHFVRLDLAPAIVAAYRVALAPGSYLAISTGCRDGMDLETLRKAEEVAASLPYPIVARTMAEIEELFDGFELLPPGLVDLHGGKARLMGGLARLS
ncbi:MAG: SAM-dependent methyltransferase [Actinobacteria bacterium]|nr:SAM-dependent methyltransferase [Actinomycetota bacterium]